MSTPSSSSIRLPARQPKRWVQILSAGQFVIALAATIGFLMYLIFVPATPQADLSEAASPSDVVQVVGPSLIKINSGTPLDDKLQFVELKTKTLNDPKALNDERDPVLTVTGRVIASLRPGLKKGNDYWQFDAPDVLTAHSDWRMAQDDIDVLEKQLIAVRELAAARQETQQNVVGRLTKAVSGGSEAGKDLDMARAELKNVEIQARRDVHDAENAVRVARRKEAALSRQLQIAGLDPVLLGEATSDVDIVMANVPEGKIDRVYLGQTCQATFFGMPKQKFRGVVKSVSPILSKEGRSLRVLIFVEDLYDQLRPGMFANSIGLGTEPRPALLVPPDGILHIGRADYALVAAGPDSWRVMEVQVGEPRQGEVEILDGLKSGERMIGNGAILLKPLAVRALQLAPTNAGKPGKSQ